MNGQVPGNAPPERTVHWYTPYRYNPWRDWGNDPQHAHEHVASIRRKLDIKKLDNADRFQWLVVTVAGAGLFVDGYLLFANNFTLPIIGYLYWPTDQVSDHETGINCATLAGAMLGQVVLGILADKLGRRKVYGWELVTVVVASLAISMSSNGAIAPAGTPGAGTPSMQITSWLIFWRFVIGFGVGAEYPLTAAITSEFAPVKKRGRMLAAVFAMQSFGQCFAAIVAYAAVKNGQMALDTTWRLIYGFAAVPAAIAVMFRSKIPESPRYTWDVRRNPQKANHAIDYMTPGTPGNETPAAGDQTDGNDEFPPRASVADFKWYFFGGKEKWYNRKWKYLLGTAGTWFLLDLAFFGLGLSSPQIVTGLYKGCRNETVENPIGNFTWNSEPGIATEVVPMLEDNELSFWVVVSIGAIAGSAVLLMAINSVNRKNLQIVIFFALGGLFFILGGILLHEIMYKDDTAYFIVNIFYALCQFLFNLGPNALTFMFPAEIFPTRYRCACLGISAAAGKFGSVVAQLALRHTQFNALSNCQNLSDTRLGGVLIGFGFVMLAGGGLAFLVPAVQHRKTKASLTLEVLTEHPPQPTASGLPPSEQAQQNDGNSMEMGTLHPTSSQAALNPAGINAVNRRSR